MNLILQLIGLPVRLAFALLLTPLLLAVELVWFVLAVLFAPKDLRDTIAFLLKLWSDLFYWLHEGFNDDDDE